MVETKAAVDHIDEILSVDGIDGIFVGPYDLSGSYGLPGEINHPVIMDAKRRVLNACLFHNKIAGQHIVAPNKKNISDAINEGYEFLALGLDTVFLYNETNRVINTVNEVLVLDQS